MANEITQTVKLSVRNADSTGVPMVGAFDPGIVQIDQTGQGMHAPVVSVGTSEADFDPGSIAAADQGIIAMTNLDDANFVKFGPKSAGSMVELGRLSPGEMATFRLAPSVVMRWVADTAACNVQVMLLKT